MKTLAAAAAAALALIAAPPTLAHYIAKPHGSAAQVERAQERNLAHAAYVARRGSGAPARWHRRNLGPIRRELRQTRAVRAAREILHRSLWLCIHRGEGDWRTGYNAAGPYYGGLQMTWGWGILEGDPRRYSADEQMHAAEVGYRQADYSTSWLFGQWPSTAPPCL